MRNISSPLRGELKPDTPRVRALLAEAGSANGYRTFFSCIYGIFSTVSIHTYKHVYCKNAGTTNDKTKVVVTLNPTCNNREWGKTTTNHRYFLTFSRSAAMIAFDRALSTSPTGRAERDIEGIWSEKLGVMSRVHLRLVRRIIAIDKSDLLLYRVPQGRTSSGPKYPEGVRSVQSWTPNKRARP